MRYLLLLVVLLTLNSCGIGEANRRNYIISHSIVEEPIGEGEQEEIIPDLEL